MQVGENIFRESRIYYADSSFLEMFSYEMIAGSAATALALPDQVTLSQSAAIRYLAMKNNGPDHVFHRGERGISTLKVTGVFKMFLPRSSSYRFPCFFKSLEFYESLTTDWAGQLLYVCQACAAYRSSGSGGKVSCFPQKVSDFFG